MSPLPGPTPTNLMAARNFSVRMILITREVRRIAPRKNSPDFRYSCLIKRAYIILNDDFRGI